MNGDLYTMIGVREFNVRDFVCKKYSLYKELWEITKKNVQDEKYSMKFSN